MPNKIRILDEIPSNLLLITRFFIPVLAHIKRDAAFELESILFFRLEKGTSKC